MNETKRRIGGSAFIFGPKPGGFDAQYYADEQGNIQGVISLDAAKEGLPGHAHGGALATLIDEAMGASAWNHGYRVVAANLNFDYRKPVPLNTEIQVYGTVERKEGRKVFTRGHIALPDGSIAVEGTGIFVEAPQYFGSEGYNPFLPDSSAK